MKHWKNIIHAFSRNADIVSFLTLLYFLACANQSLSLNAIVGILSVLAVNLMTLKRFVGALCYPQLISAREKEVAIGVYISSASLGFLWYIIEFFQGLDLYSGWFLLPINIVFLSVKFLFTTKIDMEQTSCAQDKILPEGSFYSTQGKKVDIDDLLDDITVFIYSNWWSPYSIGLVAEIEKNKTVFEEKGAKFVFIYSNPWKKVAKIEKKFSANNKHMTFVSDADGNYAKSIGIYQKWIKSCLNIYDGIHLFNRNDARSTVLLVDKKRHIKFSYISTFEWKSPTIDEIIDKVDWQNTVYKLESNVKEHLDELSKIKLNSINAAKTNSLGKMAAGIAHEINNPLAMIKLSSDQISEMIEDDPINQQMVSKLASRLLNSLGRVRQIVANLKIFSKDTANDHFEIVAIPQLLESSMGFYLEKFKEAGISFKQSPLPNNLFVKGSLSQLIEMIINLINNSIDAVHSINDKWIAIEVTDTDNLVKISITDSGAKIPEGIEDKIFQPFFTTKELGKGMGMGLSVALGIAKNHNGDLVYDKSYKNTRFIISLPKNKP